MNKNLPPVKVFGVIYEEENKELYLVINEDGETPRIEINLNREKIGKLILKEIENQINKKKVI